MPWSSERGEWSPSRPSGLPSLLLLLPQASLLDRGAPHPEVPVHLLTQGTLRSDPAGEQTSILGPNCWWGVRVQRWGQ